MTSGCGVGPPGIRGWNSASHKAAPGWSLADRLGATSVIRSVRTLHTLPDIRHSVQPLTDTSTASGDHDRFTHIIRLGGIGVASEALCGKRWVPAGANFASNIPYPNCPTCDEMLWGGAA